MALKLDLTGLFTGGISRDGFAARLPLAAATRDAHLQEMPAWRKLHEAQHHLENCRARAAEVKAEQAPENFVVLGIGGSALGNSAALAALAPIYQEWAPSAGQPKCFILDSIDPDWIAEFLESVPADKCHFNVISKSGGTIETSSEFLVFYRAVREAVGSDEEARRRFTITTDPLGGHFRKLCDDLGFATLEVPEGVGGRFSVLSPVGLFNFEMAGLDTESMLAGSCRVDNQCASLPVDQDPTVAYALAHVMHMEQGRSIHVHFPYAHRLRLLADWYKQLWAESLGKKKNLAGEVVHLGPTPVKAVGPTDQHSQCQLYIEGPDDKVYTMVKLAKHANTVEIGEPFAESDAFGHLANRNLNELLEVERQGTEVALMDANRPVCTVELCKLDAFHVGQYFAFFEIATAIAGGIMGINPFDQPGVESGKIAALSLMGCAGFEENAERIRASAAAREPFILSC